MAKPVYDEDLKQAVSVMRRGGIILYPTDTIWGIGCDAANSEAVRRIFELKRRSDSKAMLSLLDSDAKLGYYVPDIPDVAYDLMDLSEKPMTIIYDGVRHLAPELIAQDGSAGIRITREEFSRDLCRLLGGAVVSTSANISGSPSPRNFSEIDEAIIKGVDYVVSYRQNDHGLAKASSIIKLGSGGLVQVIRE
ncbi:MAG: threonylcarbamoyl-AMP synthase [Bacteroidaceae bacterium]|nr:threonylcarbamoyl-AMP synthase [Bacteroidaceae bacterium]